MSFYKTIGLISLSLLFLGCAPNIKDTSNMTINSENKGLPGDPLSLIISFAPSVDNNNDLKESISELNKSISNNVKKQFPNIAITTSQTESGLEVVVTVEEFRYVSGFGRFMAGIMVGDAILKLNVKIKDIKSGVLISDSTLDTTSETSQGIFGATTSRQIDVMAEKITDYIKNAKRS